MSATQDASVPFMLAPLARWVHRTPDGRRTFVVYARTRAEAAALLRTARPHIPLSTPMDPDRGTLTMESEAEGRAWEAATLASRGGRNL